MEKTSLIFLTLLIVENLLLLALMLIWINRHCKSCQKVKCIERIFNKLCEKCSNGKEKKNKREQTEIF
jgi:hypothetical protein